MNTITPEDQKKFKAAIIEISHSYARAEAERDLIKATIEDLSEKHEIPKKIIGKIAKIYHKQTYKTETEDHEEFMALYEKVTQ
jgi:Transcriptional regulator DsbA